MWLYPNYLCEAIPYGRLSMDGFELFKFAKVAAWALIYRGGGAVESFCFLEL